MKKYITLLLLLFVFVEAKAQQKIKVEPMRLLQLQIPINANDTIWRGFKMPDSQFRGVPVFITVADARFYSKEEVKQITTGLDKVLNPDKFFNSQPEYLVFYGEFMKKWNRVKP
jgi:hypothetical protein